LVKGIKNRYVKFSFDPSTDLGDAHAVDQVYACEYSIDAVEIYQVNTEIYNCIANGADGDPPHVREWVKTHPKVSNPSSKAQEQQKTSLMHKPPRRSR
jgi:hypothetical protein